MKHVEINIQEWRKAAEKRRFAAIIKGEMPRCSRAWPRSSEKQAVLDRMILQHIREKGAWRLNDGTWVLLGLYPKAERTYMRRHGVFAPQTQ